MQPLHPKNIVSKTKAESKGWSAATVIVTCFLAFTLMLLAHTLYRGFVAPVLAHTPDSETTTSDSAANSLCRVGAVTAVGAEEVTPEWNGLVRNTLHYNVLLRADSCDGVQRSFRIRKNDALVSTYYRMSRGDTTTKSFVVRIK